MLKVNIIINRKLAVPLYRTITGHKHPLTAAIVPLSTKHNNLVWGACSQLSSALPFLCALARRGFLSRILTTTALRIIIVVTNRIQGEVTLSRLHLGPDENKNTNPWFRRVEMDWLVGRSPPGVWQGPAAPALPGPPARRLARRWRETCWRRLRRGSDR